MSLVVNTRAQPLKEADLSLGKMKPLSCLSSAITAPNPAKVSAAMEHSTLSREVEEFLEVFPFHLCLVSCRRQRSHLNLLMLQRTNATSVAAGQVWSVSPGLSLPVSSVEMRGCSIPPCCLQ